MSKCLPFGKYDQYHISFLFHESLKKSSTSDWIMFECYNKYSTQFEIKTATNRYTDTA